MGRTLAKLLILGDGYHVSDRLPSFVLQLLTTDNRLLTDDEVVSNSQLDNCLLTDDEASS